MRELKWFHEIIANIAGILAVILGYFNRLRGFHAGASSVIREVGREQALRRRLLFRIKMYGALTKYATTSFPRMWELLRFLFPAKVQNQIYIPAHHHLLADYLVARKYRSRGARWWLRFCFVVRTIFLVFACFRGMAIDRLLPVWVRRWWS
jgi:hypothetical protein